jgi:methylisocitrate lyase
MSAETSSSADARNPGAIFRDLLEVESPLQIVGAINAYSALLAQRTGFQAIYLSGAGVANASFGIPDLGMTTLDDVVTEIRRITAVSSLPLLVDADTGWDDPGKTVKEFIHAGAAALHIEDQQSAKRCGHRPGKVLVETSEMVDRVKACVAARSDPSFVIMARTDALAGEGINSSIARCQAYVEAGADMIFAEAITDPDQYRQFTSSVSVPVLANMTEFGKSPLMDVNELADVGVKLALYPLSAFRAMSMAAENVYLAIRNDGTQQNALEHMQTREQLYEVLDYYKYEQQIDSKLNEDSK